MAKQVLPICDPHFHLWDLANRPNSNLGSEVEEQLPTYLGADYGAEMKTLPAALRLVSRVHVETVVGQMEGHPVVDTVDETRWVCAQLEPTESECPFALVAYVHLARKPEQAERMLRQHMEVSAGRLCGVRMILNHHPDNPALTWPQVESGELMRTGNFREGLAQLVDLDLSFDLSCHPHQVADAVAVLCDFPSLRVVANHVGFLNEDRAHEQLWREAMRALAELPNVFMKLSMLWFGNQGYHQDESKAARVRDTVLELIDLFGCQRCMFASNYPVDKVAGISISKLYSDFLRWTESRSMKDRAALFHDTAVKAYRLESSA